MFVYTVEGEANVIDESGEDSEEDGGGWNYYKKPTAEGVEKKTYQGEVDDQITGSNSDVKKNKYFTKFRVVIAAGNFTVCNY